MTPEGPVGFKPTKRRRMRIAFAMAVAGGALVLVAYGLRPVRVIVSPVVRGTAAEAVYATGTVEAVDRVTMKAKVAGAVLDIRVREGARVHKGDLLAVIDARSLEAELARAQAESRAATEQANVSAPQVAMLEAQARALEAELHTARDDRDRSERLAASDSVPLIELDRTQTRVAVLEAQLAANQAQRRSLRIELTARAGGSRAVVRSTAARLADAELRAPIDGVILSRDVEPGEVVAVNQTILRIGDVDRLILESTIDEADVARVAPGKKAAVALYAFPQKVFPGVVTEVLPDADRVKKSFLVKIAFERPPDGLRSGMSAEVNVVVDERPGVLLAPVDAVDESGAAWAIVDGRAERRVLRTGARDLARVELVDGIDEGAELVIGGADKLSPGARVHATQQPFNPKSGLLARSER